MQTKKKKDLVAIRLFPGEDVNEELKKACALHEVKNALIVSGIGQLKKAKIGYFKSKNDYSPKEFEKPLEILSLSGNITKEKDEYNFHIHVILGDEEKNAIGGHFIQGTIGVTGEIFLLKTDIGLKRKLDEDTGLKALLIE